MTTVMKMTVMPETEKMGTTETGKEEGEQEEMMTVTVFVFSFESLLSLTHQWASQPPPTPLGCSNSIPSTCLPGFARCGQTGSQDLRPEGSLPYKGAGRALWGASWPS